MYVQLNGSDCYGATAIIQWMTKIPQNAEIQTQPDSVFRQKFGHLNQRERDPVRFIATYRNFNRVRTGKLPFRGAICRSEIEQLSNFRMTREQMEVNCLNTKPVRISFIHCNHLQLTVQTIL